jgi:hypothetical protein
LNLLGEIQNPAARRSIRLNVLGILHSFRLQVEPNVGAISCRNYFRIQGSRWIYLQKNKKYEPVKEFHKVFKLKPLGNQDNQDKNNIS